MFFYTVNNNDKQTAVVVNYVVVNYVNYVVVNLCAWIRQQN